MPRAGRLENPVVPRMAWVAKHYNDFVFIATLGGWAEATGAHDLYQHFARIFRDQRYDAAKTVGALPRLIRDWNAPTSTRFDRYLPWLAREMNRIYKPYKKLRKKYEPDLPTFPPWYDPGSRRLVGGSAHVVPEIWLTLEHMSTYARGLQNMFRVIVDWTEAEGIDLGQWQWPDVERAASDWAEGIEVGKVVPGTVVFAWPDGWTVQEIGYAPPNPWTERPDRETIEAAQLQLKTEGAAMQHCVGEYPPQRLGPGQSIRIFSLRDEKGKPHATMEWNAREGYVEQLKGKQNALPKREYVLRMIPFRRAVLDPMAKVRPVPGINEHRGILGWFLEPYLGAWAWNPYGTLRHLIGQYGAMEAAMERDRVIVVYERPSRDFQEVGVGYDLAELDESIEEVREYILKTAERANFEDEEQKAQWVEGRLRTWAQKTWVGGNGNRPLASDESARGLDWAVWEATGRFSHDVSDEMLEAIWEAGIRTPKDPEIPAGGAMSNVMRSELRPLLR